MSAPAGQKPANNRKFDYTKDTAAILLCHYNTNYFLIGLTKNSRKTLVLRKFEGAILTVDAAMQNASTTVTCGSWYWESAKFPSLL